MDYLIRNIVQRWIVDDKNRGSTCFYSQCVGTTICFGTSSFNNHLLISSRGERKTEDIIERYNLSKKAHNILTNPHSNNLGITFGDNYRFLTITYPENKIRITIKEAEVYSVRPN